MPDYQESVTTGQTHWQKDAGQSDPLCFAGDTKLYMLAYDTSFIHTSLKIVYIYFTEKQQVFCR